MKVAVVGGCASGKTTIVRELSARGFDAYVVGQEHSAVRSLWSRQNPDALVFLDVTLDAVRLRRGAHWPDWLYRQQQERLRNARDAATVRINTTDLSIEETVKQIVKKLSAAE